MLHNHHERERAWRIDGRYFVVLHHHRSDRNLDFKILLMTPQDLRLMRKKARVSLKALAAELDLDISVLLAMEAGLWPEDVRDWADRYVEALTRLTA